MITQRPIATDIQGRPQFLGSVVIQHGPADALGHYFLEASAAAAKVGLRLAFGTFTELAATNRANRDSWFSLFPAFDPAHGLVRDDISACIFGIDSAGTIAACHALHLFEMQETTFAREAEALRVNYANPEAMCNPGERCVMSARRAHEVKGRVIFSGAAWCHPSIRGKGIARILPCLAKAYALTRWNPDFIVSYMAVPTFDRGLVKHVGYTEIDWAVELHNSFLGTRNMYFLSVPRNDVIEHVMASLHSPSPQVDVGGVDAGRKNVGAA